MCCNANLAHRYGELSVVIPTRDRWPMLRVALRGALSQIGIAEGEVFNPAALETVERELVQTYFNQGRYNVDVEARVTELERNRVNIGITVDEGKQARIRHINIVGNEAFSEKELRNNWESDTRRGLAFWRGRTQYAREKLAGDLENLRSYYLDRGYLDFEIESSQVSISDGKEDIFITANIYHADTGQLLDVLLVERGRREHVSGPLGNVPIRIVVYSRNNRAGPSATSWYELSFPD
jgi:hypothetical protein